MNVLDESNLSGRFADSLDVHKRCLLDADLDLSLILFAKLLEEFLHPWQRHLGGSRLVGHVSTLDNDLHQQLLTTTHTHTALTVNGCTLCLKKTGPL